MKSLGDILPSGGFDMFITENRTGLPVLSIVSSENALYFLFTHTLYNRYVYPTSK